MLKKLVKTLLGLVMLPLIWSAVMITGTELASLSVLKNTGFLLFAGGAGIFVLFFLFFDKPYRIYVWGHEMTHALFILLCSGRIHKIKFNKYSGYVKSDKVNFIIALGPYYFPLYAVLLFGLYHLLAWLVPQIRYYYPAYIFLQGFALAFHLVFTAYVASFDQEDIRYNGWVFSIVSILLVNILIFGIFASIPLRGIDPLSFMNNFVGHAGRTYFSIISQGMDFFYQYKD